MQKSTRLNYTTSTSPFAPIASLDQRNNEDCETAMATSRCLTRDVSWSHSTRAWQFWEGGEGEEDGRTGQESCRLWGAVDEPTRRVEANRPAPEWHQ